MSCHSGVGCVFRACKPQSGACSMRRADLHPLELCVMMLLEGPLRLFSVWAVAACAPLAVCQRLLDSFRWGGALRGAGAGVHGAGFCGE